jgi:hypothetical protein
MLRWWRSDELSRALASPEGVRRLSLGGLGLTELPPGFERLVDLEELDLGWANEAGAYVCEPRFNHLTRLPRALRELPRLRRLRLDGNPLLPEDVEALRHARPECAVSFRTRMDVERTCFVHLMPA